MKKTEYAEKYYLRRMDEKLHYSADKTLSVVLPKLPTVNSVVDVGCGLGTWLSSFLKLRNREEAEILGIDGPWINPDLLMIPKDDFLAVDLSLETPRIRRKFDLALSLEVAEHLPPERAEEFVSFLTGLSDFVLFSAAIPFQGGTNHFNERWQGYWAGLFERKGYIPFDFVRPALWNDDKISFHYRQNTFLYCAEERIGEIDYPSPLGMGEGMLSLCHPEYYAKHVHPGVKRAFRLFRGSLVRFIAGKLSGKMRKRDENVFKDW